jgi:hypothetical protein
MAFLLTEQSQPALADCHPWRAIGCLAQRGFFAERYFIAPLLYDHAYSDHKKVQRAK